MSQHLHQPDAKRELEKFIGLIHENFDAIVKHVETDAPIPDITKDPIVDVLLFRDGDTLEWNYHLKTSKGEVVRVPYFALRNTILGAN